MPRRSEDLRFAPRPVERRAPAVIEADELQRPRDPAVARIDHLPHRSLAALTEWANQSVVIDPVARAKVHAAPQSPVDRIAARIRRKPVGADGERGGGNLHDPERLV